MKERKRMSMPKPIVWVPTLLALFALIAVGYWYVYGRQRELINRAEVLSPTPDAKLHLPEDVLFPPLDGRLRLAPEDTGAVLSGLIISQKENWIINRVIVHVRITETRHCGEKLQKVFSDSEWDKHCAENPNYSVEDTVDGRAYANCNAKTLLTFDPAKQHFDFFFLSVTGHPQDPLGVLS